VSHGVLRFGYNFRFLPILNSVNLSVQETYNVLLLIRHAVTLTVDLLTLNFCSISIIGCHVIECCMATKFQRTIGGRVIAIQRLILGEGLGPSSSWICPKVDFLQLSDLGGGSSVVYQHIKFQHQHHRAKRGRVIDDLTNLTARFSRGRQFLDTNSQT